MANELPKLDLGIKFMHETPKAPALKETFENYFVQVAKANEIGNSGIHADDGAYTIPNDTDGENALTRIFEKLDEIRTEQWGEKAEDLSKSDRNDLEYALKEAQDNGEYDDPENIVEDPDLPGVSYQQVGDFVETTVTLYEGLMLSELPENDQRAVMDYEQNVKDIENSSLSKAEKERAIAALDKPDCMENVTTEKRYKKGSVEDFVGSNQVSDMPAEDAKTDENTKKADNKPEEKAIE